MDIITTKAETEVLDKDGNVAGAYAASEVCGNSQPKNEKVV